MSTANSTLIHIRKERGKMPAIVIVGAVLGTALGLVAAWLVYSTLTGRADDLRHAAGLRRP